MNSNQLLHLFYQYLEASETELSPISVKSYVSDVHRFLHWYEINYSQEISVKDFNKIVIDTYLKSLLETNTTNPLSARSQERHLSSLRRFTGYLHKAKFITLNPLEPEAVGVIKDPYYLNKFRNYLYTHKLNDISIKGYLIDINQFIAWFRFLSQESIPQDKLPENVNQEVIKEYKKRLEHENIPIATINRRLSSLRRYINFLRQEKIIHINPISITNSSYNISPFVTDLDDNIGENQREYSSFGPFRFFQKIGVGVVWFLDGIIINPISDSILWLQYLIWVLSGKRLFIPLQELDDQLINYIQRKTQKIVVPSETFYTPLRQQQNQNKLSIIIKRYKKLLNNKLFLSFHIIALSCLAFFIGAYIYSFSQHGSGNVLSAASQQRLLTFQGKLDESTQPLQTQTLVRFGLYNDPQASGSALLWQEVRTIQPKKDGTFTVTLGEEEPISQDLFSQNPGLYLGMTIQENSELHPRQAIPTVSLATNSQRLQGMSVLTEGTNNIRNAILALDSTGNLRIGGNNSPTFQATDGTFTLSGQQILLTSNEKSNGNITLSPDGLGKIDIQKAITNTADTGNIPGNQGAVEIDDRLAILATSSSLPALQIRQDLTGQLINASASGSTKFSVDYLGAGMFADNLAVNGDSLTSKSTSFNLVNTGVIDIKIGGDASSLSLGSSKGVTTINNKLTQILGNFAVAGTTGATFSGNGAGIQFNGNGDHTLIASAGALLVGSQLELSKDVSILPRGTDGTNNLGSSDKPFHNLYVTNLNINNFSTLQNLGIGKNNPGFKLDVTDNQAATVSAFITNSNTGSNASVLALGVGTPSPGSNNHYIDFLNGNGETVGSIQGDTINGLTFTGHSAGDFAEYLPKEAQEAIPSGSVVCLKPSGLITQCNQEFSIIAGVTSTHPTVLAGKDKGDSSSIVGLEGQISVRVSTKNGIIKPGDALTASVIPGVAIKATSPSVIIGHALESYTADSYLLGEVLTLVQISWYDPTIQIADTGSLSINLLPNPQAQGSHVYQLTDLNQSVITTTSSLAKAVIANLKAGMIVSNELLVSDSARIIGTLQASTIKSEQIITDSLSIGGTNLHDYILKVIKQSSRDSANGSLALNPSSNNHIMSPLATGEIAIKGDLVTQGNASISGQLTSQSLQTNEATISGTLHAKTIIADNIIGLKAASSSATYVTNITNVYAASSAANPNPEASPSANATLAENSNLQDFNSQSIKTGTNHLNLASYSGQLQSTQNINSEFALINQGLTSLGPTSLGDTAISGRLAISHGLVLADNSINVVGADLAIQPLRQGNVNFLSGLVTIDTSGNLLVKGDAYFAQNVKIDGTLQARNISTLPNQDLAFQLGSASGQNTSSSFIVHNASGSSVLTLNQVGDLVASGSGIFAKIVTNGFNIVRGAQADTSSIQTIASSSAGTAVIYKGQNERTIITPFVKANSLIYISVTSDTNGLTPYVARQTEENENTGSRSSFTIQVSKTAPVDIHMNWWIVN